jgi:hypothetical protein
MARTSVKEEYRTITSIANEITWIRQVLTDLNIEVELPMKIFCDNQTTRHITINLEFHERTKYIKVDCHFIRGKF